MSNVYGVLIEILVIAYIRNDPELDMSGRLCTLSLNFSFKNLLPNCGGTKVEESSCNNGYTTGSNAPDKKLRISMYMAF